jgi:alkanesulfonate monooxygenase SsuD/methylene tetrahydromethanopterin reductase-like flavin-dependent oxidoreductase (luciferase family)
LPDFHKGVTTLRQAAGERHPLVAAHLRLRLDGQEFPEAHIAGSPDDVAATLAAYQQAGLAYLICDFMAHGVDDLLRQMQLFAERVAPVLAGEP